MSTRHKKGSSAPSGVLKGLLFAPQDSVRDWLSWREMHPILLRSAGLVGLAVAVVVVVSDDSFVSAPHAQPHPQIATPSVLPEVASPPADQAGPIATSVKQPIAPASAEPNTPATAPKLQPVSRTTASPSVASGPTPPVQTVVLANPSADRFAVETPEPPKKRSVWPDHATQCPRDWVAGEDRVSETDGPAERCPGAAPLAEEAASPAAPEPALQEAVVERAAEIAGLQFAPRLPEARPKPPPTPAKVSSRSRRGGKLGPPPECGRKYPRWRYVNKVPTWYCK